MSIQSTLTSIQNDTARTYAANRDPGNTKLDQQDFLRLMMVQMQQQDPMNPTSNEDFLNQQAMLTQVSELETISNSNSMMQASSMIGQEVTVKDSESGNLVTETVSEVIRNSDGIFIRLSDKDYKLTDIYKVSDPTAESNTTDEATDETTDETI